VNAKRFQQILIGVLSFVAVVSTVLLFQTRSAMSSKPECPACPEQAPAVQIPASRCDAGGPGANDALAVIHAQAVWLRRLATRVQQLAGVGSGDRLRNWLRQQLPKPGARYALPMPKKTLAAQLGMTPETLSRSLRSLQEEGLLAVEGRTLHRLGEL